MAKITETTLRIRAQNLASKDLREVSTALDHLTENQKENNTAAGLAARAIKDLKDELAALKVITKNLARRGSIAEGLKKDKIAIGETEKKIRDLKAALGQLNAVKAGGEKVKGLGVEIRKVERQLKSAEGRLTKQAAKFEKSATAAAGLGISAKKTGESIAKINAEATRTAELVRNSEQAMAGYNAAVRQSRDALKAQKAIHRDIAREIARQVELEKQGSRIAVERARQQAADRVVQRRTNEAIFAQFSAPPRLAKGQTFGPGGNPAAIAAAAAATQQASQKTSAAVARETAFRDRLINVLRRQKDGGEKLLAQSGRMVSSTGRVTQSLDRNAKSLDRNNRLTGIFADTGRKSLSVYQRLRGQILATAAAYVGLFQAVNLVRSAVTKEQERRRIDIQLKTANKGDIRAAARDQKFLRSEADRLGLVYEDLAKNFANYKIAAREVGASNNTIRKSFTEASEIVTGLALSAEDADGVFRAFVQILGKARVQAEELRGQLGDRLPGAVAKFANSLVASGKIKSLSQLDEYLKKGKAGVEDLFKFLEAYAAETKNAVEEQSKTLFAQFNRLKNSYNDFLVTFAKAGVSSGLLKVVDALIAKLKGEDGGKFARDLANAFEVVGRILLVVINNFDTFIKYVKLFLGLQLAKAVVGIGSAFAIFGYRVFTTGKKIIEFTAAMNAARIAGTGLTFAMRGVLALLGPIGITIGIASAAWYNYARAQASATQQTEDHIATLRRLKTAQGEAARAEIHAAAESIRVEGKQLAALRTRLKEAKGSINDNGVDQALAKLHDKFRAPEDQRSIENIQNQINRLETHRRLVAFEAGAASKRYIKELAAEAAARKAEAAQLDNFEPPKGDKDAKEKKAKDTSKSDAALAERQKDLADRTARELLDIENELLDARLSAEITTQDQIDANLKAHLEIIGNDIEKKRVELEGLKRDAENAGSVEGVKSADLALARLPALRAEKETKAQTEAITASIELKEKNINALIAARDGEVERINALVEAGLLTETEARSKIVALQLSSKDAIIGLITELQAQLQALAANPETSNLAKILGVDELIAKLEVSKIKAAEVTTNLQLIGKNLGGQFSQGVASAFGTLIKGLAGGIDGVKGIGDAFKNAGNSFLEFLADFLVGIGQAILQAILLKAIMNAINGTSGGYTQAAVGALTGHTGGVVRGSGIGSGNPVRQVSPAVFANAQRFHAGGLPGLKNNEVPAILKKNEEVLSTGDPRNVLNGGAAGGQSNIDLSIHNNIDSSSVVVAGLNTRPGRKAIYNVIQANKADFKRMLA